MNKQLQKLAICLALSLFFGRNVSAQTAVNVSGHTATIGQYVFDYSIGEMAIISTERNSSLIITQGYLQPIDVKSVGQNANNGLSNWADQVKVYPNPTDKTIFFEMDEASAQNYSFNLVDATGKTVLHNDYQSTKGINKVSFDVSSFAVGTYFLMVEKKGDVITSFKIQKTN
jgi:hypothetical protein